MILPDLNLLIHAYNSSSPLHAAAREWWEGCLAQDRPILLPWVVALGFLRLSTHPKLADHPLTALAIEYQLELQTTDGDFAKFPGLRWHNPLK